MFVLSVSIDNKIGSGCQQHTANINIYVACLGTYTELQRRNGSYVDNHFILTISL